MELLSGWLPTRPWFDGAPAMLRRVGSYRFDDPADEVGVETFLVRTGDGTILHVPLTYRGAPHPAGERGSIATMEHSVLGRRWVYDACADPVYASAVVNTILTGGTQAQESVQIQGRLERGAVDVAVRGSGASRTQVDLTGALTSTDGPDTTTIRTEVWELLVRRVLSGDGAAPVTDHLTSQTLTGTRSGRRAPVVLVLARPC